MILAVVVTIAVALLMLWMLETKHDPLLYLVPFALAFPPLIAYGGLEFGWPGRRFSTRVVLVLCILSLLVYRILRRDFTYRSTPALKFVGPYLILVLVSVPPAMFAYNGEADAIANEFISWCIPILIFLLLVTSSYSEADVRKVSRLVVIVAGVTIIYSGLQALVLLGDSNLVPGPVVEITQQVRETTQFGATRIYGTLVNLGPNFYGAFLLFPTVLGFSHGFGQQTKMRYLWILSALAGSVVIAATYSRGAIFGLAAALIALPIWRRSASGAPLIIALIGIAAVLIGGTPVGRHVASLYVAGQFDVSASSRVNTWRGIVRSAEQHPVGLGFNGWLRESKRSEDVGLLDPQHTIWTEHPAENQWMRELADRGVLGVLSLALFLGALVTLTFDGADPTRSSGYIRDFLAASGACTIGWAIAFLTGDHLMYENVGGMFWYTTALALATARDTVFQRAGDSSESARRLSSPS